MKIALLVIFLFVSMALISQSAKALELTCSNFTGDKLEDCNYITSSGLSYDEEQEALNALWEQSYDYNGYIWSPNVSSGIGIRLLLDKTTYKTGDKIKIRIYPEDIEVTLEYGTTTITAINQAEFIASPLYNRITAKYNSETKDISFNVIETSRLVLASKILFFAFFNYLVFSLTKSSFIIKWLIVGC